MKRSNGWIDLKSVVLGICLCLAVVFLIASAKPAPSPDQSGVRGAQASNEAIMNTLKAVDARLITMDEKLARMEVKEDKLQETVMAMWRELYGFVKK